MKVGDMEHVQPHLLVGPAALPRQRNAEIAEKLEEPGERFSDTLAGFVRSVNDLQLESGKKTEAFLTGEPVDIHDVMISAEKAKTSFSLLMELRNKALDMYREVIRIQV